MKKPLASRKPLAVGDRVAVRGWAQSFKDGSFECLNGERGTYANDVMTSHSNLIRIHLDNGWEYNVDPSQCTRLVRKPRKVYYAVLDNRMSLPSGAIYGTREIAESTYDVRNGLATLVELVERRQKKGTK